MAVLSIDLAHKSYDSIGVCSLELQGAVVEVTPIRWSALGLRGRPSVDVLAGAISSLAERLGARLIFIDGPQGWKSPDNGLLHSRVCERELATQGKTGLPGVTKPANYTPFIAFAIECFDELSRLGWPRLPERSAMASGGHFTLESFPTSAWRSLGMKPLPGKARTPPRAVQEKLAELRALYSLVAPNDLSHDELQALVAGLAGVGVEGHPSLGYVLVGLEPRQLGGSWREGFIVNPARLSSGQV